jgi:paraquat-inducible protein B
MSRPASPRLIGLFVLGALALAVALTLTFGGGSLFSGARKYVIYFDGSVNGLNVGAPVKLRGVGIGRVSDIRVQYDTEHSRVLTPVIADIDLGKIFETRDSQPVPHRPTLDELVERGLRARLAMQSLVTSQLYVDVNFMPDKPVRLIGGEHLGLPEIPALPSSKDEIENTVQKLASDLRELPLKETVQATLNSLKKVEQLLSAPETQASVGNVNRTLEDLQKLIRHVDAKVDGLTKGIEGTAQESQALLKTLNGRMGPLLDTANKALGSIDATFSQAKGTLGHVNNTLGSVNTAVGTINGTVADMADPDSQLNAAVRDLSDAARSIRNLADTLERHPDVLIYGRGGSDGRK